MHLTHRVWAGCVVFNAGYPSQIKYTLFSVSYYQKKTPKSIHVKFQSILITIYSRIFNKLAKILI